MTAGTRLPLTVRREVRVATGPDRVLVHTVVANVCADSVPFTWGEHPAFSVGTGDEVDFPSADVYDADAIGVGRWPTSANGRDLARLGPADRGESLHFLVGFSQGWAAIRRRHLGVALAWDVKDFPYAWLWQEIGSRAFPFFGRASILAIEPAASWPGAGLAAAIDRGQALVLEPGQRRSTTVALIPFEPDGRSVVGASIDGEVRFAS
jgi:galactose mutarotase-like enzyme